MASATMRAMQATAGAHGLLPGPGSIEGMASVGRACVFCGSTPVTLEHVYPRWIGRKVQVRGSILLTMGRRKVRETRALDVKVKAVCASCNGGWLSDLETKFADKMLPVIAGRSVDLDPSEQQEVAVWATKTWLLLEMALVHDRGWAMRGPGILRFLYENRRPPRELSVWVGGLLPGHATLAWVSTMVVNNPPVGVITIFTIGNLVFHMFYPFPPVRHVLAIGPDLSKGFTPVWPTDSDPVTVPPSGLFDIDDMDRIWRTGPVEIPLKP